MRLAQAFQRLLLATALALSCQALAGERGLFKDPEDGAFDASEWLLDRKGFLPVPLVITEPAVGYGGGMALMFFRESIREAAAKARERGRLTPPDIYVVALGATENGTKFGGAGGMVTFGEERWRWRGGVARPDVNLDFYGAGGQLGTGDIKIGYNLEGWISTQQIMRRLGESENFVGARWIWIDFKTSFDPAQRAPALPPGGRDVTSSGLGLTLEHDSRNNFFTPSRGWKGYIEAMIYSPDFGSDNQYEIYRAYTFGYVPLAKAFVLGGRLDARTSRGDVPFYQLPYVEMRGVPAVRYQDESTGLVEAELRWDVTPRWALVGFVGAGRAWGTSGGFGDAGTVTTRGAGFRYLIARRLGLYLGADVARGPEETAIYFQAGSAWR